MFFYQGIDIGHLCMTLIFHLNEAGQFPIDFSGLTVSKYGFII